MNNGIQIFGENMAYLPLVNAAVVNMPDSVDFVNYKDALPQGITINKKSYQFVPWGTNNKLPNEIIAKVRASPDLARNLEFKIDVGYGQSVVPVRVTPITTNNGELKMEYSPVTDDVDINTFFENNDIGSYVRQQLTDINFFFQSYSELLLDMQSPESRKVVELRSKKACYSRVSPMNMETGKIEYHLYSAMWGESSKEEDIAVSDMLDYHNPIMDLKRKIGREPLLNGKKKDDKIYRYILPINLSTPDRLYYEKPYWWALFESGWYDVLMSIPKYKKALLANQMTVKVIVYLREGYFEDIFLNEQITDPEKKKARVTLEYKNIQDSLSGEDNSGKAIISRVKYAPDGKEILNMKIVPVETQVKGGEYIEDSEEASNIMSKGSGVHGSLIGSNGKTKTINGTEARELFIIQQAMMKTIRDRVLRPFYVIKAINKWDPTIQFVIPNLMLTTLDEGTGSKKTIS